jgi:hypothetical protein
MNFISEQLNNFKLSWLEIDLSEIAIEANIETTSKNEKQAKFKLCLIEYYKQTINIVDILVEQCLLVEKLNRPDSSVQKINSTRCSIIECIECLLDEQLKLIDKNAMPMVRYCYLLEEKALDSSDVQLRLIITNLRLNRQGIAHAR